MSYTSDKKNNFSIAFAKDKIYIQWEYLVFPPYLK